MQEQAGCRRTDMVAPLQQRAGVLRHRLGITFLQPAGQEVDIVFRGIVFQEVGGFRAGTDAAQGGGGGRLDGGIVRIHRPIQHGGFGCKEAFGRDRRTKLCAIGLSFLYQGQERLVTAFQLRQGIQGRGGQGRILGVRCQLRDVFLTRQETELSHQEVGEGRVLCFGNRLLEFRLHRGALFGLGRRLVYPCGQFGERMLGQGGHGRQDQGKKDG